MNTCARFQDTVRQEIFTLLGQYGFTEEARSGEPEAFDQCWIRFARGKIIVEFVRDRGDLFLTLGWKSEAGRLCGAFWETWLELVSGRPVEAPFESNLDVFSADDERAWFAVKRSLATHLEQFVSVIKVTDEATLETRLEAIEKEATDRELRRMNRPGLPGGSKS